LLRSALFLVSKGVPYDVAFSLKKTELQAYCIIMSEIDLPEEQHFDFDRMCFKEPKK